MEEELRRLEQEIEQDANQASWDIGSRNEYE